MDCYIIPTVNNLDLMYEGKGNRFYALAHFYVQYPHYREFFLNIKKKDPSATILLDNSAAEKSLVTEEILLDIVKELKPDEVIALDILFDKDKTIEATQSFINHMISQKLINDTKIFGCPQGKNKEEWIECYDWMLQHSYITTIGLSKIAVPKCWGNINEEDVGIAESRNRAYDFLLKTDRIKKPLHFLGMGDIREYNHYDKSNPLIRSTDSCYTVLAAVNGVDFSKGDFRRIKTTNDFYTLTLSEKQIKLAKSNIEALKFILA